MWDQCDKTNISRQLELTLVGDWIGGVDCFHMRISCMQCESNRSVSCSIANEMSKSAGHRC